MLQRTAKTILAQLEKPVTRTAYVFTCPEKLALAPAAVQRLRHRGKNIILVIIWEQVLLLIVYVPGLHGLFNTFSLRQIDWGIFTVLY